MVGFRFRHAEVPVVTMAVVDHHPAEGAGCSGHVQVVTVEIGSPFVVSFTCGPIVKSDEEGVQPGTYDRHPRSCWATKRSSNGCVESPWEFWSLYETQGDSRGDDSEASVSMEEEDLHSGLQQRP